jgi:hypothetical protein
MSRIAHDLAWFLDSLDDPPVALHEGYDHIGDDVLGGPRMTHAFERWLTSSPRAIIVTTDTVVCTHPLRSNGLCLACAAFDASGLPISETGFRRMDVARYRWPMRAAMDRVRGVTVPEGLPDMARTLWAIAVAGNLADAASVLAYTWPALGDPRVARAHMGRALSFVRQRYRVDAPLPRRDISDAQADAEAHGIGGSLVTGPVPSPGTNTDASDGAGRASEGQCAA